MLICSSIKAVITTVMTFLILGLLSVPASALPDIDQPLFNDPQADSKYQRALIDTLGRYVDASRRGDEVRIVNYSYQDPKLSKKLILAHYRGVNVRVITDGHLDVKTFQWIKRKLGTDRSKRSYVYDCVRSCRGSKGLLHTKFYAFSRSHTVLFGSSNITKNAILYQYNDLFAVSNRAVHAWFVRLFGEFKLDRPAKPMSYSQGPFWFLTFPHVLTPRQDPIMRVLSTVKCRLSKKSAYGHRGRTLITISMHGWGQSRGIRLARKVHALWKDGCIVQMAWGDSVGGRVKTILKNVPHFAAYEEGLRYDHMKVMLINGRVLGHANKLTWTGSSNWSNAENRDELVARIDDDATYDRYREQFVWLRRQFR